MSALSYMIKYLPCLLVNFQAAIYKAKCRGYFWQNVEAFGHVEATTTYTIKRFHLLYRVLALLQRILLILTTPLLLKALEES